MIEFCKTLWMENQTLAILCAILVVVVPLLVFYVVKALKEHPKGLIPAALANMGERFGYYIMNAVLLLFLCSKFGISDDAAGWIYAVFYFLIYVLADFAGWYLCALFSILLRLYHQPFARDGFGLRFALNPGVRRSHRVLMGARIHLYRSLTHRCR